MENGRLTLALCSLPSDGEPSLMAGIAVGAMEPSRNGFSATAFIVRVYLQNTHQGGSVAEQGFLVCFGEHIVAQPCRRVFRRRPLHRAETVGI